ncbi:hypothetical protein Ancab_000539 [Ancistrocladus abbreviatus]
MRMSNADHAICIDLLAKADATLEKLEKLENLEGPGVFHAPINFMAALGLLVALRSVFREWEAACSNYDTRVSNVILESFLNRDIIYEANLLFKSQARRGAEPNLRTLV